MIRLHIDRLVIEGFGLAAADAPRLEESLQAELGRLLAGDEAGWSSSAAPALRGPDFAAPARPTAEGLGAQIATALHGGLRQ